MDYQAFVNACTLPCAVLSVEKADDGTCGTIRIVCANAPYKAQAGPSFRDNMPYDELTPKDLKFEDFCARAAFGNQRTHAYVQTKSLDGWTDLLVIPLQPANERLGYCQFIVELTDGAGSSRIEHMSHVDTLTGLNNRNAMIRRMETHGRNSAREPFGVVNLDLNGLKITNDRLGHDAGDQLLVEAAELLRKIYYEDDVFRTGGDEFIVLADGIDHDVFERKLQRLKYVMHKNNGVSLSVGAYWSDGSTNLQTAFRRADEDMYANKRLYYVRHPEMRRQ